MTVTIAEQKMSNSVVKVTDPHKNDSLILVVGEDGTVTPDKDTVESYLSKYFRFFKSCVSFMFIFTNDVYLRCR